MARARGLPTSIAVELLTLSPYFFFYGVISELSLKTASIWLLWSSLTGRALVAHWYRASIADIPVARPAIPIINTRPLLPTHIGNRYPNFPPSSVCQKTKYIIGHKIESLHKSQGCCQYPVSIELRYRRGAADGRAQLSFLSGSFGGQAAM